MEHSFDTDIANDYGIPAAILLKHICYWTQFNKAHDKNFHDGRYWTYFSRKAFKEMFYYLGEKQIRNALSKLEESELIVTGNYNKMPYDRTKWYSATDAGIKLAYSKKSLPIRQKTLVKTTEDIGPEDQPIPYIKTDIKTNKKEINKEKLDEFISSCWSAYPRKLGKGKIKSSVWNKLMDDVGEEQMMRCIERYKDSVAGKEDKFVMHGSTFFHGGYVDFLDENVGHDDDNVEESIWQT